MPLCESVKDRQKHRSLRAACALLLVAEGTGAGAAHETTARFTVTANVLPVLKVDAQSAPSALEVAAADVERGYVEVAEPMRLRVQSNAPGCTLELVSVAPLLSSIVLRGLGSEQRLGAMGGTLVERWAPGAGALARSVKLELRFRLELAPGIGPGRYPWPLRLWVRALEPPAI